MKAQSKFIGTIIVKDKGMFVVTGNTKEEFLTKVAETIDVHTIFKDLIDLKNKKDNEEV